MSARQPTAPSGQDSSARKPPVIDAHNWGNAIAALKLSPRQAAIVELILRGQADKEIATELNLSIHTVRTYLYRIFARLGVKDRTGVVLAVAAMGRASCPHAECPHK